MVTNADCTIFNKVYDPIKRLDSLVATKVKGVFWEDCKAASMVKLGLEEANAATIYIPFSADFFGKQYVKPKAFKKDAQGNFTLESGDIVVKGLIDFAGSAAQLEKEYDDVILITSIDTMDYGSLEMQHWEVGGK